MTQLTISPQKSADGRPPVADQNLPRRPAIKSPRTEEPPDGGPPSIRGWNLPETIDGRDQPTTSPIQEVQAQATR